MKNLALTRMDPINYDHFQKMRKPNTIKGLSHEHFNDKVFVKSRTC